MQKEYSHGIVSTCSWSPYLPCNVQKLDLKVILTSIRTTEKRDFCDFPFARLFWLVHEIDRRKYVAEKTKWCGCCVRISALRFWLSLGRYEIYRSHVIVERTWTQKRLVVRRVPPRGWTASRQVIISTPFSCSREKYQVQEFKVLGSECQTSGACAKRAKQATKKDNAAACLCFLNYLAFLRPAADRAVSILPWVASPGRSYGFLWVVQLFKKMWGRTIQLRLIRQ
jgi:hypothetical protein